MDRLYKFGVQEGGQNRGTKKRVNGAESETDISLILIAFIVNNTLLKYIMAC